MLIKSQLEHLYVTNRESVSLIAKKLGCSENKVTYWLQKYGIKKRSISEAVYIYNNPKGNPFVFTQPKSNTDWFLYGIGLGLFWGEGNKVNKHSVRLGNTDPDLIKVFLLFLHKVYKIDHTRLRFGLQLFTDTKKEVALDFWVHQLGVPRSHFQKVVVTPSQKAGTYRKKCQHGVLTVYFSNTKLRDTIMSAITELRNGHMPS